MSNYLRTIHPAHVDGGGPIVVDVYSVLEAFGVACPARQHAIKKLLCAGQRGSKTEMEDLCEAKVAIERAIAMVLARKDPTDERD